MLTFPEDVSVYLLKTPCDMRKGFDKLAALAESFTGCCLHGGGLFVFVSKRRDRMKALYWDEDGYCLWYKRLEVGAFRVEEREGVAEITGVDLNLLLSGMSLSRILFRKEQEQKSSRSPGSMVMFMGE